MSACDGHWYTYIENWLTGDIDSDSEIYNCHEDMLGDYTACEYENH